MAKPEKREKPTVVVEATEAAADVAAAVNKERRRLERQLATALRTLATRLDQLVAAEESKGRKAIEKRRRQADDAASKVAELTDKLTILAGTGIDAAASAPVAAVKAVGAATARAAKPVAKAAGTAAKSAGKSAGTAAKTAGSAAKSAGSAAKAAGTAAGSVAGSAAKAAGAATTRVAGSATRSKKPSSGAGTDGVA